jgi:hypothetical protein
LAFEDLERDPIGQLQDAYESLGLGGFEDLRPKLEGYVATLSGYEKNAFSELPSELKARIRSSWSQSFEAWYAKT